MKSKIFITSALAAVGMAMTSCVGDFLDQKNTTNLNEETFFESDAAVEKALYPLYNYVWNDFNGKFYYGMGDGRANNLTAQYSDYIYPYTNFNENALSPGLADAWNSLYSVVAQSSNVVNNIIRYSTPTVSEKARLEGMAEARFMRGYAYWYIACLWGDAIIYTDTKAMVNNYVVPANPRADVMEFAIRDLEYAARYLPAVSPAKGRINKYAAYAMLSRVYLFMAGLTTEGQYDGSNVATDFNRGTRNTYYLDLARKAAEKVINESDYRLMANYGDLFTIAGNNCAEDIFQLQWLSGSTDAIGWGCNQSISAFFGWSTMVSDGTNWGGATYCSWNLFQEFCGRGYNDETGHMFDKEGVRMHESIASYGETYTELNTKGGGYTYGVTENQGSQGANVKKYVVGTHDDNGVSYKQSSGINTHMIRLAEVYLNYVEAVLGNNASTSDAKALEYFKAVRKRAGMSTDVAAVDFVTLTHERRVEFAFKGLFWYDLVRRSYYRQQEVVNYLNNQDRNRSYKYETSSGKYEAASNAGSGVGTATVASLLLPYADTDVNKNAHLKRNADGKINTAPYAFGEREVDEASLFN